MCILFLYTVYSGIVFYGWMTIDSADYTKWAFGRDLKECIEKLYGTVEEKEIFLPYW